MRIDCYWHCGYNLLMNVLRTQLQNNEAVHGWVSVGGVIQLSRVPCSNNNNLMARTHYEVESGKNNIPERQPTLEFVCPRIQKSIKDHAKSILDPSTVLLLTLQVVRYRQDAVCWKVIGLLSSTWPEEGNVMDADNNRSSRSSQPH